MNREVTVGKLMRTPLQVMLSVWLALFLREAVGRLMAGRIAWFWLLAEPIAHALFIAFVFGYVVGQTMPGVDFILFLLSGLMGWKMFNLTMTRCMHAVDANQGLFSYRQVKPVDTVLVRAALEGFLALIVAVILMLGTTYIWKVFFPADPAMVSLLFLLLWLLGSGMGLILSVAKALIPDSDKVITIVMLPMYLISGIMFPATLVPEPYRSWMLVNPVLNGLELLRAAFFPGFPVAPGASLGYLAMFTAVVVALGLALHVRYERQLVMSS